MANLGRVLLQFDALMRPGGTAPRDDGMRVTDDNHRCADVYCSPRLLAINKSS